MRLERCKRRVEQENYIVQEMFTEESELVAALESPDQVLIEEEGEEVITGTLEK